MNNILKFAYLLINQFNGVIYTLGRLLGMQILLGSSEYQNIIHFSQKPPNFKENDLKSISSWPQQGYCDVLKC